MSTGKTGTSKTSRAYRRGSQREKWSRRAYLMDGRQTIDCSTCGDELTGETLCVGRIDLSRGFARDNIQPVCAACASRKGAGITNALHVPDETHILRFRVHQPPDVYCLKPYGLWHVAAEPYALSAPRESYMASCGVTSVELLTAMPGDLQWSCATWPPAGRRCRACGKAMRRKRRGQT